MPWPYFDDVSPRSLITFFVLTFAVAWIFFITAVAVPGLHFLFLLGVFAPAAVALWLTRRYEGGAAVSKLLRHVLQWRVGVQWYVFAVAYIAAIKLIVAVIHRVAIGRWPRFGTTPWYVIAAAIVISTAFQAGEEIGWRGYALPRLAERFGFAYASVLLGIIWAFWHLPQFVMPGADTNGQSFLIFALQVTAFSVALTWLYVRTKESLLLTMLMHSAANQTKDIVPSAVPGAANPFELSTSPVAWLTVGLLWICAAYFLARMPSGRYAQRVSASIVTSSPGGVSPM